MQSGKCATATWEAIAADPGLGKLPSSLKSVIYDSLAVCVGGERAVGWAKLATAEKDAPPLAWAMRFVVDVQTGDKVDALLSLDGAVRASKTVDEPLSIFNDDAVFQLRRELKDDGGGLRHLLTDLDEGDWIPKAPSTDASGLWREYSLMLLQDRRTVDAVRVGRKVTLPRELLAMRLDKQFDPIISAHPEAFDVTFAAFATLERQRKIYAAAADDSEAYQIIDTLRLLGRLDEALSFADATLAKKDIRDSRGNDYRNWIEDRRAYVLFDLGRFDEGIVAERASAGRKENDQPNVSNAINLAGMLNGAGRHADALAALAPFEEGRETSPYGAMWVAAERACAATGLADAATAAKALSFTQAHVNDNRNARVKALLCANQPAEAAAVYVAWLQNPVERTEALVQLCHFAQASRAPFDAIIGDRFGKLRDDPAVQAAVAKVGRTDTLTLYGSVWIDFQ